MNGAAGVIGREYVEIETFAATFGVSKNVHPVVGA
jgi:hypothetical protein